MKLRPYEFGDKNKVGVTYSVLERFLSILMKLGNLFLGLLALVTNVDYPGMTVTLDPFIDIE